MKRRRQSPGSRSKPRTTRAKYDCLDVLTGDEAQIVLKDLLSSRPDLISDARRAANALLATVSFADVAADVFGALQALDLDDLDAGPRPGGYIEPSEAAWNVIEKVVTPYFHDLERRVKLRHEDEALEVCKGIVLGLYRAEHRGFELLEYAEDSPSELAGQRGGDLAPPTPRLDIPAQLRREVHAQLGMARSLTEPAAALASFSPSASRDIVVTTWNVSALPSARIPLNP